MMHIEVKIVWKTFCKSLKEHAMNIIDFKKKQMKLLTKELL